jgi:hypothetical protein
LFAHREWRLREGARIANRDRARMVATEDLLSTTPVTAVVCREALPEER